METTELLQITGDTFIKGRKNITQFWRAIPDLAKDFNQKIRTVLIFFGVETAAKALRCWKLDVNYLSAIRKLETGSVSRVK